MTGVQRGARVTFRAYRNDKGENITEPAELTGLVLDCAFERGDWWVSVPHMRRAVCVAARDMTEGPTR